MTDPTAITFKKMRERVHRHPAYRARGMTDRWRGRGGYARFLKDMGPRPDGYVIHRVDNDRGYWPDNCVWIEKVAHDYHHNPPRMFAEQKLRSARRYAWSRYMRWCKALLNKV